MSKEETFLNRILPAYIYLFLFNTFFLMVNLNVIKIFKSFKKLNTFKFSPQYKLHVKNLEVKDNLTKPGYR